MTLSSTTLTVSECLATLAMRSIRTRRATRSVRMESATSRKCDRSPCGSKPCSIASAYHGSVAKMSTKLDTDAKYSLRLIAVHMRAKISTVNTAVKTFSAKEKASP